LFFGSWFVVLTVLSNLLIGFDRDELLSAMQKFTASLKTLFNTFEAQEKMFISRTKLEHQLAYLTEAESTGVSHPVHSVVTRFTAFILIQYAEKYKSNISDYPSLSYAAQQNLSCAVCVRMLELTSC